MKPANEANYLGTLLRRETVTADCPIHGPFEQTQFILGDNVVQVDKCPQCREVEWEAGREAREKAAAEERWKHREQLIAATNLPQEYRTKTFENFTPNNDSQRNALNLSRRFVKGWEKAKAGGYGLLFFGACGTGKTHLASAILCELIDTVKSKYYKASEIFTAVRRTYSYQAGRSEDEVIDYFSSIDLLVIDELGVQKGSDAEKRILFSILDNRLSNKRPTLLLTNLKKDDLKTLLGERLYDRARSKCVPSVFIGDSMRKPATPDVFD